MVLPLFSKILYGPVNSRRLGKSLGINLMPTDYKLCSFNCIYCHFGWTQKHAIDCRDCLNDLPAFGEVVHELEQAFKSSLPFDSLTFSGNGESTLYPHFAELVDQVVRIRDQYRPKVKIVLLSNSTGLADEDVRSGIAKIDIPFLKLDAGTEHRVAAINRPARGIDFAEIVNVLSSMEGIYIQTLLLKGSPSNVEKKDLEAYFEQISRIQPKEAHIYSIDRPVPASRIALVSPERLEEIASQGQKETGVEIKAWYPK